MTSIAILVASRGRPSRLEAMIESAHRLAGWSERVRVLVRLDDDDPELASYERPYAGPTEPIRVVGPRPGRVASAYNQLARGTDAEILMAAADDVLFRTPTWDFHVAAALGADGTVPLLGVPADGREASKGRRATHFFATRAWVDAVGYLVPEAYEHFWADTHVADVASRSGRLVWLDDVLVEHMHPNAGKGARDETYGAKRAGPKGSRPSDRDGALYAALEGERHTDAMRVIDAVAAAGMRAVDG